MNAAPRPLPPWLTVSTGRVVDGRACRTRAAFFEEVARALRFPDYFGRNWDALTDCLRDLGAVTLVVQHAEELLADEPAEQLATLLTVLADAAHDGLSVRLCTDAGHGAALRARLADALG
ncbi:barstar family protein [Nonomuraea gerenzanensis]|uniref:Barstar (barnase inhibitor) domain-containing protein n=1 Tax=Nonomuraea gerenzanensis TaxID=93944 RepID=A0A1M4EG11_9ACTN|nr:barstar family protein [Nonomuraea gerenzanensis]UBU09481.1 barstar family protein [Nonomuraea gerenzanensis]SBO97897.1 hypothetical protein BN4615_P7413 [Nonomuraea gerenzanensis]